MTMFNGYIMVDWSAANSRTTGADSIWVAELLGDLTQIKLMNYPTRTCVRKYLKSIMKEATEKNHRLLIGFDFPFGYPANAYSKFCFKDYNNWYSLSQFIHDKITDTDKNKNNRFDVASDFNKCFPDNNGPFWGRPTDKKNKDKYPYLKNENPKIYNEKLISEFRHVEDKLKEQTGKQAKSVWQLFSGVTVGSQTLMGIPTLHKLKKYTNCAIWPFESIDNKSKHVIAEIYPSIWKSKEEDKRNLGLVKDAGQVKTVVEQIFCHDRDDSLQDLFNAPNSYGENITEKEGWILGVDETGKPAKLITSNRPYILYD